jgi:hypothetical protein
MLPNSPLYGQQSSVETPQLQAQRDFIQRQEAARQQNTRYGDFSQPAGQAYSNGLDISPEAMAARQAQRLGAMQPGGAQMQQRFGPASPLGQQASQYASDQARKDAGQGVFIQEGGYGQPQEFLPFNNTRLGAEANARAMAEQRRTDPTAPGYRSAQTRTDQLKEGLARRQAALASGLPKQRAQEKMQRLQDRTLKRAVARGLNPLSPQAQAMYPEAAGRLRGALAGGGLAPANPENPLPAITSSSPKTTDTVSALDTAVGALMDGIPGPPDKNGNPTPGLPAGRFAAPLRELGFDPKQDTSMSLPHKILVGLHNQGTSITPADAKELRTYALRVQEHAKGTYRETSPFSGLTGILNRTAFKRLPDMYQRLVNLPEDAPDSVYQKWVDDMGKTLNLIRDEPVEGVPIFAPDRYLRMGM